MEPTRETEERKTPLHLEKVQLILLWTEDWCGINGTNYFTLSGYIVEGGVTRQPYGGHRVCEALNSCLTQSKYTFFSDLEFYFVRLAMEQLCFVTNDYKETMRKYHINPAPFSDSVDVSKYNLPKGSWE
ncbi:hypothetical protein LSAT2_008944 [Lamellibrachia satsuma]|nr:hypothetical protein LSAT2_008944 [Lamellibrachia satsuma]